MIFTSTLPSTIHLSSRDKELKCLQNEPFEGLWPTPPWIDPEWLALVGSGNVSQTNRQAVLLNILG